MDVRPLPNVSDKIDEAPSGEKPRQIVSSKGLLSPQKSKAIMERLKQSVNPTDILERYTAVVESGYRKPADQRKQSHFAD